MPCIFAMLAVVFPRVAIVLLFLFTNFFAHIFPGIIVPIVGFLFLPLTLLVYAYLLNIHAPMGIAQLLFLLIAVIFDLGLVGGGAFGRRRRIA